MKIAILSDTHSRYQTVEKALELIEGFNVHLIIHCGDIDDSETVWLFPPNTHFVFGNCDHEKTSLQQAMYGIGATLHQPFGNLELQGKKIAFTHGDDGRLLKELEINGDFDFLFHGHTHIRAERENGPTRIINPGALHRAAVKTFAILDLENEELETVVVE